MNYADTPFGQRLTLAADWNRLVRVGRRVTVRQFAARHGLKSETWRRRYAEYDSSVAQDAINGGNANKGARMRVTNQMALLFRKHVLEERRSSYHPKQRPKGPKPHPAMTIPSRLTLDDRPAGATHQSHFRHYEMDTVISSTRGTGSKHPWPCEKSPTPSAFTG